MKQVIFNATPLLVVESSDHVFLLSSKDVANGYGVSESLLRSHRTNQSDELIEGKHFIIDRSYRNTPKTYWTKLGVITLGFFIKSERAKEFRKWAANYVLNGHETDNSFKETIMCQNEQIAQLTLELNSKQKLITEKPQMSATASNHLLDLIGQVARYIEESEHIEQIQRKRRERIGRFMNAFIRAAKHSGITEQSQRKSEEIYHGAIKAQPKPNQ